MRRTREGIEITQDSIGCFGLFLYRDGRYWALSNSFNHLLDYLKSAHKLTFNKDYADALLSQQLCISLYGETIIREIAWLDRRAQAFIDTASADLTITYRNLIEKTISADTMEGIRLLDAWHDKWSSFARRAESSWPGNIRVDVSGGFDTRMALVPILSSGIKTSRLTYNSNPKLEEDLRIASSLAKKYGFSLNQRDNSVILESLSPIGSFSERSLAAIYFEKEIYLRNFAQSIVPTIAFTGFGGGMVRGFWEDRNLQDMLEKTIKTGDIRTLFFKRKGEVRRGAEAIVRRSFQGIDTMLKQVDSDHVPGALNGLRFYMETRNRSHFGMSIARNCLSQSYNLVPLLDPLLLKLRTPSQGQHSQLICAIILTRYHDGLLSLPIEGGRSIADKTILLAQELNRRFPRKASSPLRNDDESKKMVWQLLGDRVKEAASQSSCVDGEQQPDAEKTLMHEKLLRAFESATVQNYYKKLYRTSTDFWINPSIDKRHPNANKYAAVAIAKAMSDVEHGKGAPKDFAAFIEACLQD